MSRFSFAPVCALSLAFTAAGAPPVPDAPPTEGPMLASARKVVSLKEALTLASQNSAELAGARAQAAQVESQANRVWGAILPEINAGGSVVHTSAPAVLPAIPGVIPSAI